MWVMLLQCGYFFVQHARVKFLLSSFSFAELHSDKDTQDLHNFCVCLILDARTSLDCTSEVCISKNQTRTKLVNILRIFLSSVTFCEGKFDSQTSQKSHHDISLSEPLDLWLTRGLLTFSLCAYTEIREAFRRYFRLNLGIM